MLAFVLQENVAYCLQEKPIGDCSGMYKKQQLFQTKRNYGKFIPLMSLVKAEDFFGSPPAGNVPFGKYLCTVRAELVIFVSDLYIISSQVPKSCVLFTWLNTQ
jgi:hypothetical protein